MLTPTHDLKFGLDKHGYDEQSSEHHYFFLTLEISQQFRLIESKIRNHAKEMQHCFITIEGTKLFIIIII